MTATTRVITSLYRDRTSGSIVVEDVFATGIDDLWSALTDPQRLARWLVTVPGDVTVGNAFGLRFTSGWEGTGEILEGTAPTTLRVVTTEVDGDATTLTATLTEIPGGTRLRIQEDGLQPGRLHVYGAGWAVHLEDLDAYLADRPSPPWATRWAELSPLMKLLPEVDR